MTPNSQSRYLLMFLWLINITNNIIYVISNIPTPSAVAFTILKNKQPPDNLDIINSLPDNNLTDLQNATL